jgi:3-dehydroquinate synthase
VKRLKVNTRRGHNHYEILIGRGSLDRVGHSVRSWMNDDANRVAVISDQKVLRLYGKRLLVSLKKSGFQVTHWTMKSGEAAKTLKTAEQAISFLNRSKLQRNDVVLALGGGVVGDLTGFAASIYLRGISFVNVPTTLLAQIDSSVGGKTAVNLPAGKNLVGSFHQPSGVVIDVEALATLPRRELVSGWCEAVKQGAVAGTKLFTQTTSFLERSKLGKAKFATAELEDLIAAHCTFKAAIVQGDEREQVATRNSRSRRILNFGHTVGHALEAVTGYRRFRHGEAVGHGMLVAGEISKNLGLLAESELELLVSAARLCGRLPPADDLDVDQIMAALARDKKSVSDSVQWVLLERIGRARIVDGKQINPRLLRSSIRTGLRTF